MNLYLSLTLVFCALNAIYAAQEYEFTNEQVNCKLKEDRTKMLCNLSGNVECGIRVNLPEEILNDEKIDMLVFGFEDGQETSLKKADINDIKFTLYTSNVDEKKLTKASTPLELYYSETVEKATQKGLVITDKKCYDELIKLFKVVTFIKKEQNIDVKSVQGKKMIKKAIVFGEVLLKE
jgi:hypothetical protein